MSEKKTVTFEAKVKKAKGPKAADIPTNAAPNQLTMQAGKDGGERTEEEFAEAPIRDRKTVAEQFPVDMASPDKKDVIMTEKLQLQEPDKPGVTPFGQLIADDSDFQWLAKKREKEEEANFMQWFAWNFDRASPEQKALAQQLWPDFYTMRLNLLKKQVSLQEKIAELKLFGPKTYDDLVLQYAIESGYIDADPMENILHPERAAAARNKRSRKAGYVRGLLNPRRLPRGDWGLRKRETNAQELLGKDSVAFGGVPAYKLGTQDYGFSASGLLNADEEAHAQNKKQLEALRANF